MFVAEEWEGAEEVAPINARKGGICPVGDTLSSVPRVPRAGLFLPSHLDGHFLSGGR